MTFKTLTIATAIVFMCGLGAVAPASAQNAAPAAPAAAAPAPDAKPPGPAVSVPSSAPKAGSSAAAADQSTPYGITHLWVTGSWIDRFIMIVLAIMSAGTWYIFISKFIDQARILGHSKLVDKRFWTSATISEGIEKLPKNSLFRAIAESGLRASSEATSLVGMNDWIGMSLS